MGRALVRLGAVRVAVPDPDATARFLVDAFGFHASAHDDVRTLTCGGSYGLPSPSANIELVEGPGARLRGVAFDLAAGADAAAYRRELEERGLDVRTVDDATFEVDAPGDVPVSIRCEPDRLDGELPPSPLRPVKLGHVNLKVADPKASLAFFHEGLGLALSEQVGDHIFFLRAGSDHHNLGLRGGAETTDVHHIGFEIPGWETYRVLCDHIAALGHKVEYGPGRHGPGNNLFIYVRDPSSGLRLELYSEMAHIDDDEAYVPKVWQAHERVTTVNRWGPQPPESFLE